MIKLKPGDYLLCVKEYSNVWSVGKKYKVLMVYKEGFSVEQDGTSDPRNGCGLHCVQDCHVNSSSYGWLKLIKKQRNLPNWF